MRALVASVVLLFASAGYCLASQDGAVANKLVDTLTTGDTEQTNVLLNALRRKNGKELDDLAAQLLSIGRDQSARGDNGLALKIADSVLELSNISDDNFVKALRLHGSASLRLGANEAAIASFGSALGLAPNDVFILWQRCWAATEAGFFSTAEVDCARAREVVDRNLRRLERSKSKGFEAGELEKSNYFVLVSEGFLAANTGRSQRSVDKFEAAKTKVSVFGASEDLYVVYLNLHLGRALLAIGQTDEALAIFQETQALQNTLGLDDSETSYQIGILHLNEGRNELAFDAFQASRMWRGNPSRAFLRDEIRVQYALCTTGARLNAEEQTKRVEALRSACERAEELRPYDAYLKRVLAALLYGSDDYDAALKVLNRALELQPENPALSSAIFEATRANNAGSRE